jgi:transposase
METIPMATNKKKAQQLNAHLVFLDESGFLLIPNLRKTWSPKGKTPLHYHSYERGKISTIGAISVSPKRRHLALYLKFYKRNVNGLDIKDFLSYLLKHLHGNIILLWDGSQIHRRNVLKEYLQPHSRLQAEEFPGYAPELNPAEYIWNQADHELSNSSPEDLQQLETLLSSSANKLSNSQQLLWSCIYASDLPWKRE